MQHDDAPTQRPVESAPGVSTSTKREDKPSGRRTWRKPSARARAAWLKAFAECGVVLYACEQSGVARRAIYWLKEIDVEFAMQWEAAYAASTERLEREAIRRATGFEQSHFDKNGVEHTVTEHSDRLLEFVLMSRDDKYRVRRLEMTGKDGGAIDVNDTGADVKRKLLSLADAAASERDTVATDE